MELTKTFSDKQHCDCFRNCKSTISLHPTGHLWIILLYSNPLNDQWSLGKRWVRGRILRLEQLRRTADPCCCLLEVPFHLYNNYNKRWWRGRILRLQPVRKSADPCCCQLEVPLHLYNNNNKRWLRGGDWEEGSWGYSCVRPSADPCCYCQLEVPFHLFKGRFFAMRQNVIFTL